MNTKELEEAIHLLYNRTGVAMMYCKRALIMFDYDLLKTEQYLLTDDWKAGKLL